MEPSTDINLSEENASSESERFIAKIAPYPKGRYSGRGIVICGGGVRYFTNAWVCINILRQHGCNLPIQIWHLGQEEMDERMVELVRPLGVHCVDGRVVRASHPVRILNGWELKPYAITHSPFSEVLLLDADNVAVANPEYLFDTPEYGKTGAIFWPDYGRLDPDRSIWNICGIPYRDEPEFESGQILIDKQRCWNSLQLCIWYNGYSDFFYQHVHGDKETFHLAFRKLNQEYSMPKTPIYPLEATMCQHDFDGKRVFQHRNLDKWSLFRENMHIDGFLLESECLVHLGALRKRWDGVIKNERRYSPAGRSKAELYAAKELTAGTFCYKRVGFDQRPMHFRPNGAIGLGGADCEKYWNLTSDSAGIALEIASENEVTCRLKRDPDGAWRGRWLIFERMPVEIARIDREWKAPRVLPDQHAVVESIGCESGWAKERHQQIVQELQQLGLVVGTTLSRSSLRASPRVGELTTDAVNAAGIKGMAVTHRPRDQGPNAIRKVAYLVGIERVTPAAREWLEGCGKIICESEGLAMWLSGLELSKPLICVAPPAIRLQGSTPDRADDGLQRFGAVVDMGDSSTAQELIDAFQLAFPTDLTVRLSLYRVTGAAKSLSVNDRLESRHGELSVEALTPWLVEQDCLISLGSVAQMDFVEQCAAELGIPIAGPGMGRASAGGMPGACSHLVSIVSSDKPGYVPKLSPTLESLVVRLQQIRLRLAEAKEFGRATAALIHGESAAIKEARLLGWVNWLGLAQAIPAQSVERIQLAIVVNITNADSHLESTLASLAAITARSSSTVLLHADVEQVGHLAGLMARQSSSIQLVVRSCKMGPGAVAHAALSRGFERADTVAYFEEGFALTKYQLECLERYVSAAGERDLWGVTFCEMVGANPDPLHRTWLNRAAFAIKSSHWAETANWWHEAGHDYINSCQEQLRLQGLHVEAYPESAPKHQIVDIGDDKSMHSAIQGEKEQLTRKQPRSRRHTVPLRRTTTG